jgi:hypothetical protein
MASYCTVYMLHTWLDIELFYMLHTWPVIVLFICTDSKCVVGVQAFTMPMNVIFCNQMSAFSMLCTTTDCLLINLTKYNKQ